MDPVAIRYQHRSRIDILKPILRAYALGYLSSTTPRIISCLRRIQDKRLTNTDRLKELFHALTNALRLESFPTFCALLIGGSTIAPLVLSRCLEHVRHNIKLSTSACTSPLMQILRFVSAFLSAWYTFQLLNKKPIRRQGKSTVPDDCTSTQSAVELAKIREAPSENSQFVGRSMDLTLFSLTRAADLIVCIGWQRWQRWRKDRNHWTLAERVAPKLANAGAFAASAAIVMWAWFYMPERLPRSYERWIGEVAKVDARLIEALRRARRGVLVYGKNTGQAPLLQSMCRDYGWPLNWGDPSSTVPIPCEMVHMGCGPSCEKHAVSRFARTFKFACATYIPIQLLLRLRKLKSMSSLKHALSTALRSSAFLASFVSMFYYSVCLARTRLGPKIFPRDTITPMMWDSGLCVGAGCLMCGWSILIESAQRRQEIALFVAPRAAATVMPRFYDKKYLYRERIAFAISAAVLLTCAQERPEMVRGVFGRVAASVLR
ncbi:integral membrane protein [Aspergillus uvarum CBS 121591]|uniref:Integral membrane protein n=1 Tax=Aspergillus uvarum CBS 121591 TaxID=1448315 RepID=A0A319BWF5_9EURO|nr:integral membrane protein [Aspergillus uvarum CBS 121591]PYH78016.1 integral membrane protein [Aspergillus uvarum CBS 121591]